MEGKVIKNTGSLYLVEGSDGVVSFCKVKGSFRVKGIRTTSPVSVGDDVEYNGVGTESEPAYITHVKPRLNYIIRKASNLSKEAHILASNLDSCLLIVTLSHPTTSTTFIDRFLATAEAYHVPVIIAINKIDLLTEAEDKELLDAVCYLYRSIGYTVCPVSATTGVGLDALKEVLNGKISLLSGNSGVGKSSLINELIPGADLKTGQISDAHDTGVHTTTFSEMFKLPYPMTGAVIDTPGVRGFGTVEMEAEEVSHFFPEIFNMSSECRFGNCTHTHEPGCAVRDAVEEGRIAQSRYSSYLSILEDAAPDKYRKAY